MSAIVLLVAPFWVGAYILAGWAGVAVMAVLGFLGEALFFGLDELHARRQAAIARRRWERWHD